MVLFPDKIRNDKTYSFPGERPYSFLNRSALDEFEVVREKLNSWFSHYPASEQYELKKRLQSKKQFYDAFFELYVHEFFNKKNFQLAVHPELEHTTKQPDFFVSNKKKEMFYLEVKVVRDESDEERDYKEKQKKITHELNKLGNFPYWISIRQLEIKNQSSFSIKPLIKKVREVSKTFDYLRMIKFTSSESLFYEDDNIKVALAFWPRSSSRIIGTNRAVGVHGYFRAGIVNTSNAIYKAIEEKARKYGNPNHPFIIALNCISPNHFSQDDLETLIGKDFNYIKSNKPITKDIAPLHDGIFSNSYMNHVAALFIIWVTPYNKGDEQWYWCENPNFENKTFQKSLMNQIF